MTETLISFGVLGPELIEDYDIHVSLFKLFSKEICLVEKKKEPLQTLNLI